MFALGLAVLLGACAPRAISLRGDVVPARLPAAALSLGYHKIYFRWRYTDRDYRFAGEGVARIAPPDSARLDFFVDGGMGGGYAVLLGDTLRAPGPAFMRNLLPPTPLLWAALGRLHVPPSGDTAARLAGDTLRADLGTEPRWRVSFVRSTFRSLEMIEGGRVTQSVHRDSLGQVTYTNARVGRTLELTGVRSDPVTSFDSAIWR
jgi:hypothetical protein